MTDPGTDPAPAPVVFHIGQYRAGVCIGCTGVFPTQEDAARERRAIERTDRQIYGTSSRYLRSRFVAYRVIPCEAEPGATCDCVSRFSLTHTED